MIVLVLLMSGCLRSLQFTALQALSLRRCDPRNMSQATSISSMTQRLAQSLGIAVGAYALELSSLAQGHASIVATDFPPRSSPLRRSPRCRCSFTGGCRRPPGTEVSGHVPE